MDFIIGILSTIGRSTDKLMSNSEATFGLLILGLLIFAVIDIALMPRNQRNNRGSAPNWWRRRTGQGKNLPDPRDFLRRR